MKKLLLFVVASMLLFSLEAQNDGNNSDAVIFLVRHAEKVDNSTNPELSLAGKQRANQLAEMLSSTELDFVFSTDFIRTRKTAEPIAQHFDLEINLYNPRKLEEFAQMLKQKKGRHLVVGHSNTTPQLVDLLGGKSGNPIDEKDEYDRLYVLTIGKSGEVKTVLLRYGKKYISK